MGDLLLVRHGETEWSRSGQHTSWTDLPLTQDGEEQAKSLAPLLSGRAFSLALTSPLRRAVRTAELAGVTGAVPDPDVREWDYGGYEGVTTVDIHRSRPDWYLWTDGVPPGPDGHPGESPAEVGARADRVLPGWTWHCWTAMSSSWRTVTSCVSSRPGGWASRRRTGGCSSWRRAR